MKPGTVALDGYVRTAELEALASRLPCDETRAGWSLPIYRDTPPGDTPSLKIRIVVTRAS